MNEYLNTDTVRQLLNRSAGQLDQPTLDCLRKAREQALLRHAPDKKRARWADAIRFGAKRHAVLTAFASLVLTISLAGGVAYYWSDTSDLDIAILTDDVPVDVYAN